MRLPSSTTYGFWLALLRIYTGAFWLMHGVPKFTQADQFMPPNGAIVQFLNDAVAHTSGPYQQFLTGTVVPHISLFAELVRLGEVVTGCLLLLGFFTRLGGLIGVVLALDYLTAKGGLGHTTGWSGLDAAALALSAINIFLPTGRFLGVDGLLARTRRPAASNAQQAVFVDEPPMSGPTAPSS